MNRRPVRSSNVASIGWEPNEGNDGAPFGTLEVEFLHGGTYRYKDVPRQAYMELLGASSIGKTLRQLIIGSYEEERV
jgi:KTSC domain